MLKQVYRNLTVAMLALCLLFGSGEIRKAEAGKGGHRHKKVGFFTRMKRAIKRKVKRVVKKTRRAIYRAGAGVKNKIMDGAVRAKSRLTGKKPKYVWVKGHYKKGKKHHTSGHFRYVRRHGKKPSGGSPAPAPAPAPGQGQGSSAPGLAGGSPLPPIDPSLPSFSKSRAKVSKHKTSKRRRR